MLHPYKVKTQSGWSLNLPSLPILLSCISRWNSEPCPSSQVSSFSQDPGPHSPDSVLLLWRELIQLNLLKIAFLKTFPPMVWDYKLTKEEFVGFGCFMFCFGNTWQYSRLTSVSFTLRHHFWQAQGTISILGIKPRSLCVRQVSYLCQSPKEKFAYLVERSESFTSKIANGCLQCWTVIHLPNFQPCSPKPNWTLDW